MEEIEIARPKNLFKLSARGRLLSFNSLKVSVSKLILIQGDVLLKFHTEGNKII